jgi:hypothetical protein
MNDPSPQADGAPALVLESTIDAAEMARIDRALKAALLDRALGYRARRLDRADYLGRFGVPPRKAARVSRWLSLAGLMTALALAALGGVQFHGLRVEVVFGIFFTVMMGLSFVLENLERPIAWVRTPWLPYWDLIARIKTASLLKRARASVPFEARYEFQADMVAYSRIVGGRTELTWKRRLQGVRVSGPGFTLLYKKPNSQNPHAIFLHQPSARFDALLDSLAVQSHPVSGAGT